MHYCVNSLGKVAHFRVSIAVSRTSLPSLSLLDPPQYMLGNIADRFFEGVPNPTPFAPSNLDVDSVLFGSCPQIFIPYDPRPVYITCEKFRTVLISDQKSV